MREGPHDRVRDDEVVEDFRHLNAERLVYVAEMPAEQLVERGVVPRLLVAAEPPVPVGPLGSEQRLARSFARWCFSARSRVRMSGRAKQVPGKVLFWLTYSRPQIPLQTQRPGLIDP